MISDCNLVLLETGGRDKKLMQTTSNAVQITTLDVPKSAWNSVNLNCRYELSADEVFYMAKWYKDDREFFRCTADGSVQTFPLDEIKIYYSHSSHPGSCSFELTALTQKSGGEYKCEVSLDYPTFQTVSEIKQLAIREPEKVAQTSSRSAEVEDPITNANDVNSQVYPDSAPKFLPTILVCFCFCLLVAI